MAREHFVWIAFLWVTTARFVPWAHCQQQGSEDKAHLKLIIDGDRVDYSADRRYVTLKENVTVVVQAPGETEGSITIKAETAEADLEEGIVTIDDGGAMAIGPGVLTGGRLVVDAANQEFTLDGARGYFAVPPPPRFADAGPAMIYFTAKKMEKVGNVAILHNCRLTSCPHRIPDYSIRADRVKYNIASRVIAVDGAEVEIHGIEIPLLPWFEAEVGKGGGGPKDYSFGFPGYDSRDGFYVPLTARLLPRDSSWQGSTKLRLTAQRGIIGDVNFGRTSGDWDIDARISRKAWMVDDIEDSLSVSRYPQIEFTKSLTGPDNCHRKLDVRFDFGNFTEELENQPPNEQFRPKIDEQRALVELDFMLNPGEYELRRGGWVGTSGRISHYSNDETFRDLMVLAGLGGDVSDSFHIDATISHHWTDGSTPFLFDDVDIKTELTGGLNWALSDRWRLKASTRYDLDIGDMRDYQLSVNYRAGCLTWGLSYRDVGNSLSLGLDLTGLTGQTRPVQAKSRLEKEMEQMELRPKSVDRTGVMIEGQKCR